MKKPIVKYVGTASGAVALLLGLALPRVAHAQQIDTNPPLPNVLLMVDNSGSMERMIDGTLPEATPANACNCTDTGLGVPITCNWAQPPVANRWNGMQQALTGTLQNGFNCVSMPRTTGSTFATEYQIGGNAPYDVGYYLGFHRMVAQDNSGALPTACVVAPGSLPGAPANSGVGPPGPGTGAGGSATDYSSGSIINRAYGALSPAAKACSFAQLGDGAITSMSSFMRFGMMTFDQDPSPAIGVSSGPPYNVGGQPFAGMWSYFPGWNTGGASPSLGNPANCATQTLMAVGARNPAAPPWEGRLVYFPTTNDLTAQQTNNQEIQRVILATRPYGATPLAGMFAGAKNFFWNDPQGPQNTDGYVSGSPACRSEYIILLSDGAPNLDMQPACSAPGAPAGVCPFPMPQTTAATLFNNGKQQGANQFVTTFVIGFAVSAFQDQGSLVQCSQFAQNGALANQCDCSDPTLPTQQPYGACCELQCIARNGGSTQAYFADTLGDLRKALNSITALIAKKATTRTTPAFSQVATSVVADPNAPQTNASIFLASFNPSPGQPWAGDVQRQRYVCTANAQGTGYTVPAPSIATAQGDDFAANLNSGQGPQRTFIAFLPDVEADGKTVDSSATIRPYVAAGVADKLGLYSAKTFSGAAASVMSSITPPAFGASCANGYTYTSTTTGAPATMSPALCSTMALDYLFAQPSFGGQPANFSFVSRTGNAFGDIYHATPAVVGPPAALLQEPLYVGFRSAWAARKQVVYAATNDGLLHAFWADEDRLENNEMWAMVPPAVVPNLVSSYPSSHQLLLDGAPVIKDVVWERNGTTTDPAVWHTMLVAGYGPQNQGYYAVDVTNPDPSAVGNARVPPDPPAPGPVLRWQLTKMPSSAYQIFGKNSATPAITTLFMDPDGNGVREIGVAILPGGRDGAPSSVKSCLRAPKISDSAPPAGTYSARASVRCWGTGNAPLPTDPVNGRSLSIVRLDTGEILRVFARAADIVSPDLLFGSKRVTDTPLDSPMTGTPIVFPVDVGADATKIFVGDEDGTIWRFDVSNTDPSKWVGELYLDLYNKDVDPSATSWADGQPFSVTPVVSLDPAGRVVLNAATGNTDQYDTTGVDLVYSITEMAQLNKLRASVNWWLGPPGTKGSTLLHAGERVSGPMTVFNGTFYFATYNAGVVSANACSNGLGTIWGLDYVTAKQGDPAQGGLPALLIAPNPVPVANVPATTVDPSLAGAVVPGVSIKATPACASLAAPGPDQYVPGATHSAPQNFSPGGFSLFTQVGKPGVGGIGAATLEIPVQTPTSPTVIDSWAAVVE